MIIIQNNVTTGSFYKKHFGLAKEIFAHCQTLPYTTMGESEDTIYEHNRKVNAKKALETRNALISMRHKRGDKTSVIAARYNISPTQVRSILRDLGHQFRDRRKK